jgi:GNAT acetyltransferase-like protein
MKPVVHGSIAGGDGEAILGLYGDRAEGPAFVGAWERAGGGANQRFVTVGDQTRMAAASPAFLTRFNWLSLMPGGKALERRDLPIGRISMAGLGLIQSSELGLSIDHGLRLEGQKQAFEGLLDGLEALGVEERADFLLVKDLNDRDLAIGGPILARRGFGRMAALPLAYLHLPFETMDAYLASLSRNRRRSLLRNMAKTGQIEVEFNADISSLGDELHALGEQTRKQAATQFSGMEATPKDFFSIIADAASHHCRFTLYRLEGKLVGFTFNMVDGEVFFAKTIGLSYPEALEHKIYFLNIYHTIKGCIEAGIEWLAMGQLAYETKLALGCKLEKRWLFIRGRGWFRPGFALAKPYMSRARLDPSFKPFDRREVYFSSDANGPQPPVNRIFSEN